MVIWSYPTRDQINPEALDLVGAATSLGIKNIRFPDPYQVARGFPDEHLGLVYAASDVLMCVSKTEGFGIPIVEAQAIGIPAIVTEYYPFLEVSGAHPGELTVSVDAWELQQMLGNTWMPIPTLSGTVTAMKYFHEKQHSDSMKELARNRKAHAQKYTWSLAAQKLDAMFKAQSGAGM
jgi:glycosyltransferase involved in cell wall biosynthesis